MTTIYEITPRGKELCDDPTTWEGVSPESREILRKTLDDLFGKDIIKEQQRKSRFETIDPKEV